MNPTIVMLAIAACNTGIAMRVVEPMLPQLATDFDRTVPAVAGVITAFAIAQAVAQYFHGPTGDRFGKLRVVTALMVLSAVACFGCASASDFNSLVVWRFTIGFFSSGTMTLGLAHIADVVPVNGRQAVLARYISGTLIGQSLGPLVGGVMTDTLGWRATFVALGIVFAAVALMLFIGTRAHWPPGPSGSFARASPRIARYGGRTFLSPARYIDIIKGPRARYVMVTVFLEMVFFYGAWAFLGAMLKEKFDLPFTLVGLLLAGYGIGGLIYTMFVRRLLARLGQRGCVLAGGLGGAAFFLGILLMPSWPPVMICTIGIGFSFYLLHNTLQAKATEIAPHATGTALALFSMSWASGQAVGAALMGVGVAFAGYAPMIVLFALGFALVGVTLRLNLQRL